MPSQYKPVTKAPWTKISATALSLLQHCEDCTQVAKAMNELFDAARVKGATTIPAPPDDLSPLGKICYNDFREMCLDGLESYWRQCKKDDPPGDKPGAMGDLSGGNPGEDNERNDQTNATTKERIKTSIDPNENVSNQDWCAKIRGTTMEGLLNECVRGMSGEGFTPDEKEKQMLSRWIFNGKIPSAAVIVGACRDAKHKGRYDLAYLNGVLKNQLEPAV